MDHSAPPAAEAAGVARSFGGVRAVDGVTMRVAAGEVYGVLGPDGAGKTTLLRMLVGLLPPSAGSLHLFGQALPAAREAVRHRIGYMPQQFALYGDLTVAENLDYCAEVFEVPRGERASREADVLAFSRLAPYRSRAAQDLSGGMKQKLALACALIHRPELLVLDEPTTGVDPLSRRDLWRILYRLAADGSTLIVSTPAMDEAERCSRVALMDRGRFLREGAPAELRASLTDVYLEVQCADPRNAMTVLRGCAGIASLRQVGDRIHATAPAGAPAAEVGARIEAALSEAGAPGASVRRIEPDLDDVFVSVLAAPQGPGGSANA